MDCSATTAAGVYGILAVLFWCAMCFERIAEVLERRNKLDDEDEDEVEED